MVLSDGMGVKGARVNGATASVGGKEFRESSVEVIGDKGGDDVFVAIRNDKKVTRTDGIEVVLPSRARKYTWLRTCGTRSMSLYVSIHCFGLQRFGFGLLVQDHGQGGNRGRGMGWDVFNKGGDDG